MMKIPVEKIIEKIKEKTNLSESEIQEKINQKEQELSGLISKDGAAHIVANEYGIRLFEEKESGLFKLKDIATGLKTAAFVARVVNVEQPRTFKTEKREGKVCSFSVADGSGKIRVVFWDTNHIDLIEQGKLSEGDIVKITNCYVKEGYYGIECHTRSNSEIDVNPDIPEAKDIPPIDKLVEFTQRVKIKNIENEGVYEIHGAIVDIKEKDPFFEVCPECRKSMRDGTCPNHGEIKPKTSIFISTVFDDSTGNIRVVFFGNQAEKILGISAEEAKKIADEKGEPEFPIKDKKMKVLGKELIVEGKVSQNDFSGELEMIGRKVTIPNPSEESEKILKELENEN